MRRYRVIPAALLAGVLVPDAARALDLTGKWRFEVGTAPAQIIQMTQVGTMLSFTYVIPFSGTVSTGGPFATYAVTASAPPSGIVAAIGGRIMPSENLLDGRAVSGSPGSFLIDGVVATRCSCDDGDSTTGDGCNAECRVEPCWTCTGDPSVCTPASEGSACEDGSACTTGEACTAGACGGGAPVSPCTDMTGLWSVHREIPDLGQTFDFVTDFVQRGTDLIAGSYVGTIDPATGAFDLRTVNPNLFCPAFDPLTGAVAPSGATYAATGLVWQPRPSAPDLCDAFSLTECGSTTITPIEACDETTTTTTTTSSTTTTTTPASPACAAGPLPSCRLPVEPGKAKLILKNKTPNTGDTVKWKWVKGAATPAGDFGDPTTATDYVACLYDGASARLMTLRVPAAGTCGARPCWKSKGTKGFAYADKERTPDGVTKLTLGSGPDGKAKIALSARGDEMSLPALGNFVLPLRLQLQGNGLCWEAVYGTPQDNSTARFKALAD